ncbi:hypothetical protein [Yoonia algicola]|uniref:Uncharacterized protein n=1 Tax=Yoonia algicola TaxID=3137368 RepID=A0AAN0LZR5_9RHOB
MQNVIKTIGIIIALAVAPIVNAQSKLGTFDSREETTQALQNASDLSRQIEDELLTRIPAIDGWDCTPDTRTEVRLPRVLQAIPHLFLVCVHSEQTLRLTLYVHPYFAELFCTVIEQRQVGIRDGNVNAAAFRFFEDDNWRLMRASVDLQGCSHDILALNATGARSQAAIDAGPDMIDAFGEAILEMDVADLVSSDTLSLQQDALQELLASLRTQSNLLAGMIPLTDNAGRDMVRTAPSRPEDTIQLPLMLSLHSAPTAAATLDFNGCRVMVDLSASEPRIREATDTGIRWAQPKGRDGTIFGAFRQLNTDRLVGLESLSGTGIEALIDGRMIVRVVIPGQHHCQNEPGIVARLFDEILASDFSGFGLD